MIYIDASRYNNTANRTGVENYSYFLIQELVKAHPEEITLISPRPIDLPVPQIIIPFPRLWTHLRLSMKILRNKKIQTLFVPSHVLPLIHPKKSVITIHDVAFLHSPRSYSWTARTYLDWSTRFAVKHAQKIITPSEKTKQDLLQYYGCSEEKIKVIPLGFNGPSSQVSEVEETRILKKFDLQPKSYFLYVGRIEWKKNTDTLIKAFLAFAEGHPRMKLVLAGFSGHGGEEILQLIPKTLASRILQPGYIFEEEKQVLLKQARCFIFPSREEGFGLPLLEAMNAGVPILASNIPTSQEIAGKNAFFFAPEDTEALATLMEKVMKLKDPEELKINRHSETLKTYSWKKSAQEVYELLKN